jgi:PAS domain S-box-containing protein
MLSQLRLPGHHDTIEKEGRSLMSRHPAARAALFYLAAGSVWILLSDALVFHSKKGVSGLLAEHLQLVKGLFLIVVTAVFIFLLLQSALRATQTYAQELERRVLERTEELTDIYNLTPCGYHTTDTEGRIVRINDYELDWLGFSRDEVIGRRFSAFLSDSSRRSYSTTFSRIGETGRVHNLEFELVSKNGSLIPVLLNATADYDRKGVFLMSRSTMIDMTSLVEARERIAALNQDQISRNCELERLNEDLSDFSYTVSHDLVAPLRAVIGFAEIIRDRYSDRMPAKGRHYLDNILAAGERMDRLIHDLLRYARLGTTVLQPVPLALVLDSVSREIEGALAETGGRLLLPETDAVVTAEESLLRQIISNLVENALHYRDPGRTLLIEIFLQRTDGSIKLSVRDNGIGIAAEYQKRIFRIFQRLGTASHEGTGVGLAIARRAAEKIGGYIEVKSSPGAGSTFTLTLREAAS